MRALHASLFKQKDIEFLSKLCETDDQYNAMEEAAVAYGDLEEIAPRLGVAERFLFELWQVRTVNMLLLSCVVCSKCMSGQMIRHCAYVLHAVCSSPCTAHLHSRGHEECRASVS